MVKRVDLDNQRARLYRAWLELTHAIAIGQEQGHGPSCVTSVVLARAYLDSAMEAWQSIKAE